MAKGSKNIAQSVWEMADPLAEDLGLWIWDVEFVKEGARKILRITVDSEEGVNINDCEALHRAIDPLLDEADLIDEQYYLEVSSPGIERELKTDVHIEACEGWDVEIRLYAPQNGSKIFRGVLLPIGENNTINIQASTGIMEFERESIAKISTYFEM